jgi:hypothetical protein
MSELKVKYNLLNKPEGQYISYTNSMNDNLLLLLNKVNIKEINGKYLINFFTNKPVYTLNGKLDDKDVLIKNDNIYLTESGINKYQDYNKKLIKKDNVHLTQENKKVKMNRIKVNYNL